MKHFILLLFICFVIPNSENDQDITYWSKRGFYQLTLKSDNTFILTYRLGYHLKKTWGHWERANREFHLHGTYSDLNNIPMQVEKTMISDDNYITFVLNDNLPGDYSLYRRQLLLNDAPVTLSRNSIRISNQSQILKFRVRTYVDYTQIEMGRMIVPFRLHRAVLTEEYEVNLAESNHFKIHWDVDGAIFNYDPIARITLKKRFNRLIWVEKNLVFKKSRNR